MSFCPHPPSIVPSPLKRCEDRLGLVIDPVGMRICNCIAVMTVYQGTVGSSSIRGTYPAKVATTG